MALILRERLGAHAGPRPIAGSGAPEPCGMRSGVSLPVRRPRRQELAF
jgi:hypothetical protein